MKETSHFHSDRRELGRHAFEHRAPTQCELPTPRHGQVFSWCSSGSASRGTIPRHGAADQDPETGKVM